MTSRASTLVSKVIKEGEGPWTTLLPLVPFSSEFCILTSGRSCYPRGMSTSSYRPPQRSRQQWLLSFLLFAVLVFLAFMFLLNPQRANEQKYANAQEVPLSRITAGYANHDFKEILIRDSKVYATQQDGTVLQSYKEGTDTVSQLGWNDPKNKTTVTVENREATNMFFAILPDLVFFLLIIAGVIWLFRGIARSQSLSLIHI